MCQCKASAGKEPLLKTYLTQIHTCWKYSQVIKLPLKRSSSAGCPHNCASPLTLRCPQEKPHQWLPGCWFMNITLNHVPQTTTLKCSLQHLKFIWGKLNLPTWPNSGVVGFLKIRGAGILLFDPLYHPTWTVTTVTECLMSIRRPEKSKHYPPK